MSTSSTPVVASAMAASQVSKAANGQTAPEARCMLRWCRASAEIGVRGGGRVRKRRARGTDKQQRTPAGFSRAGRIVGDLAGKSEQKGVLCLGI